MLTLDTGDPGLSLSPQHFMCLGSIVSLFGLSRVGPFVLVLDCALIGLSLPLQDCFRVALPLSICGAA